MSPRQLIGLGVSCLGAGLVFLIYWLGGGDFERGWGLALTTVVAVWFGPALGRFAASYPSASADDK